MSSLANWFKKHEHSRPSAEIQLFKDFLDGKINPKPAAILLTKNIEMKEEPNDPLYDIVETLVALGVHSLNTAIQKNIVKLASAIRTIRKHSLSPGNKIPPCYYLGEIDEIIGDWWSSLRSDGEDLDQAKTHRLWISINEFCAHLTAAEVCDWSHRATFLCDDLLDNPNLRENPILFSLALSAAAHHMIHAASNFYSFCERARTSWNLTYRWEKWKAMFHEAATVENIAARNDALSAAVAMDTAERLYNHLPIERERRMNTRAMSKQSKQNGDIDGQTEYKNMIKTGRKRGVDEAFLEYNESGT